MDLERHFLETVRENRNRMYRVAMSFLHAEADAEDAVSAAIESAWNRLGQIRNPDALGAYLVRCVVNCSRDELRRRKKFVPLEAAAENPAAEKSGDLLFDYICGLEDKYRIPLILKMQERMTEKEIASALRLPRGTVSTRIGHALKILKENLAKEGLRDAEE